MVVVYFIYVLLSIKMINLSLNELKLIAQIRNISNCENNSKEDLIKALNKTKPKTLKAETPKTTPKTKPKTTPKQTLKPETPKQTLKPETLKKHLKQNQKQHQNKH